MSSSDSGKPGAPLEVMHLMLNLGAGGMEHGVLNICHGLPQDNFRSTICVLESGGDFECRLDRERVRLVHVERGRRHDPTLPLRLAREIRHHRIDILHTHNWGTLAEGWLAGKLSRVPVHIHGEHGLIYDKRRQIVAQRLMWRGVAEVTAVSEALADRLANRIGFRRERIRAIPNGVDSHRFSPTARPNVALQRKLGIPADSFVIGMIGRLSRAKNHAGLLKAVSKLCVAGAPIQVVIAGVGSLRDELGSLACEMGIDDRVKFIGYFDDVPSLLAALDVMVFNSTSEEGMPNVVLEAMASGLPVVAADEAAASELMADGAGIIIPPGDWQALANALEELLDCPKLRDSLAKTARLRVEQKYSLATMIEAYGARYLELASANGFRNGREFKGIVGQVCKS